MAVVVVVGGGLAGARAVREFVRAGQRPVTLVCEESHPPYDRPPLSKKYLTGEINAASLALLPPDELNAEVAVRLGVRARRLDIDSRTIELSDGSSLEYDNVVLATGSVPKWLPRTRGVPGAHVLRTVEDAQGLKMSLRQARHLVVIGAGVLGCEVASSARVLGVDVTLVEALAGPMYNVLGSAVSNELRALHEAAGVRFETSVGVSELVAEDGPLTGVRLSDGRVLDADVVLLALGACPAVDWLADSGLDLVDGVGCDERGMAAPGVWAAGDIARRAGSPGRVEHWTSASDSGAAVARAIIGEPQTATDAPPYFWSDQHGVKLQSVGWPAADCTVDVRILAEGEPTRLLAAYHRHGRLVAALGIGAARHIMRAAPLVSAGASPAELFNLAD